MTVAERHKNRRLNLVLFAVAALMPMAAPAWATSPPAPFEQTAFQKAQAASRTIVVETYAAWCMPCRVQAPILDRLRSEHQFRDVLVLRVGEKSAPEIWKRLDLSGYGSLVIFRGYVEVARGTPTDEIAVRQLLLAGIH